MLPTHPNYILRMCLGAFLRAVSLILSKLLVLLVLNEKS